MRRVRVVARLDVKDAYLVKGIQLEGLRKLGEPHSFASKYYKEGIDEIIYLDTVASLYERNNLSDIVISTTKDVFIPITVGGGIRRPEDVTQKLMEGADKIAINTAAIKNPKLLKQIVDIFGSQCIVLSIQAKRIAENKWEAYYDNGRERSGIDVMDWIKTAIKLGVGEVMLTSIDCDGLQRGMDYSLIESACSISSVPIIAAGGVGKAEDVKRAAECGASAIAIGSALHYEKLTIGQVKQYLSDNGIEVRRT